MPKRFHFTCITKTDSASGHAVKNSGGQACSWIRCLYCGRYWNDLTMAREHGMPPSVLARDSPMSDRFQALPSCPFYLVDRVDTC